VISLLSRSISERFGSGLISHKALYKCLIPLLPSSSTWILFSAPYCLSRLCMCPISLGLSLAKVDQNADDCQVYVIITLVANEASVAVDRFTLCRSMDGHDQSHVD